MRGRESELMDMALADLRRLGYAVSYPDPVLSFGRKVRQLSRQQEHFNALIQVRAHQPADYRYLVGLVIPEMRRVATVIIWCENERKLFQIPTGILCDILDEREDLGDAKYATRGRQWRVDFHLDEEALSPQGSGGERYSISQYSVSLSTGNAKRA